MTIGSGKFELVSPEPENVALKKVEKTADVLPELAEEAERIDMATFTPEEAIEREGDFKQAEEIERAFVAVIKAPATPIEAEEQETTGAQEYSIDPSVQPSLEGAVKTPVNANMEEPGASTVEAGSEVYVAPAEGVVPPKVQIIEAKISEIKDSTVDSASVKLDVISAEGDGSPDVVAGRVDALIDQEPLVVTEVVDSVGIDPRRDEVGYLGEMGSPEDLAKGTEGKDSGILSDALGKAGALPGGLGKQVGLGTGIVGEEADVTGEEGGLPGSELGGGKQPAGAGKFDGVDSLTSITDGAPGVEDLSVSGLDQTVPLNKQSDLSPGISTGGDPRLTADEGETEGAESGEGEEGAGESQEWSGSQEWTDKTDSEGNQEITGKEAYDDGDSITTVETTHSGGVTTQEVTSINKKTGAVIHEIYRSTPLPDDVSGDYDFTLGGTLPAPEGSEPIKQPLTEDTVMQPTGEGGTSHRNRPTAMPLEDAMAAHINPYALWGEDHVDVERPDMEVEAVDKNLVDPPKPESETSSELDNEA